MKINVFYVVDKFHEILYDRIFFTVEDANRYCDEIIAESGEERTVALQIREGEFRI